MTITAPPQPAAGALARVEAGSSPVSATAAVYGMDEALADMEAAATAMLRVSAAVGVDAAVSWPASDRQRMLRLFDRVVDGATAGRGTFLVAEQRAGTWRRSGDRSLEAFRVRTSGVAPRSAAVQVRQAEHLAAAPDAAAAVTGGTIGFEHGAVLARLTATGSPAQQAALAAGGQAELLECARRQDAGTFATTVARWAAEHDPVRFEADHQAQRRERYLHLSPTGRGTVIKGLVDTMAGHRLRLALEAVTPRPAADDDRSPGQRAADALDTMATAILSSADTKPGAHVPPHVSLILSEDTFVAARAHLARQRAATKAGTADAKATGSKNGDGGAGTAARAADAGRRDGPLAPGTAANEDAAGTVHAADNALVQPYPPVTLEDGTPVPISEAAAVLCDCAVTRVGIDADSVLMDLGRTQRLFTGEQRRAILARDRECIWPTCHMPARWLQIHHRIWWERDNGTTCLENGVAVCSFHHQEIHRQDLKIVRIPEEPADGPPGRKRRRTGEIAMATYELRDPTGCLVGQPRAAGRNDGGTACVSAESTAARATDPPVAAETSVKANISLEVNPAGASSARVGRQPAVDRRPDSPHEGAPEVRSRSGAAGIPPGDQGRAAGGVPTEAAGGEPPDELLLEWTTDPFTGARMPAAFVSR